MSISSRLYSGTVLCSFVLLLAYQAETVLSEAQSDQTPMLGAYVESLCPDSRRFVVDQLVPANKALNGLFKVKIVPFGHARVLSNNRMICQHGQNECDGNRLMACVLHKSNSQDQSVNTIGCMFESLNNWKNCIKKHMPNLNQTDIDDLDNCKKGEQSYKMMIEAEKETGRVGYVPHLTLNGKHDNDIQTGAEDDLKKLICQQYKTSPKPLACNGVSD